MAVSMNRIQMRLYAARRSGIVAFQAYEMRNGDAYDDGFEVCPKQIPLLVATLDAKRAFGLEISSERLSFASLNPIIKLNLNFNLNRVLLLKENNINTAEYLLRLMIIHKCVLFAVTRVWSHLPLREFFPFWYFYPPSVTSTAQFVASSNWLDNSTPLNFNREVP